MMRKEKFIIFMKVVVIFIIMSNIITSLSNAGDVAYILIPEELEREIAILIENLKKKKVPEEQIEKEVSKFICKYMEKLIEESLPFKRIEEIQKQKERLLEREKTTMQERLSPHYYSGLDKPKPTIPIQPKAKEETNKFISVPKQEKAKRTSIVPAVIFGVAIVGALCSLLLRKRK